ncbi:MAG: DUF4231 domain-containing protein [Anaerolineae bacterium]|nr:DUF4231 domain-containing protein [Anaerolineae bacterium]
MSTPAPSPRTTPPVDPPDKKATEHHVPITQGRVDFRKRLPIWVQEMPQFGRFRPTEPDPNYQLLNKQAIGELLKDAPDRVKKEIFDDIDFMDYELLRLFRQRDYQAKYNQNRYRRQQIFFLILAVAATLIGSLQVVALNTSPDVMPLFAFLETLVALLTAFLAAISGRESPQELWLTNRRRAEQMRREYFRFLTHMPPYDEVTGYQRRMLFSQRAADVNRGMYPQELPGKMATGGDDGSV